MPDIFPPRTSSRAITISIFSILLANSTSAAVASSTSEFLTLEQAHIAGSAAQQIAASMHHSIAVVVVDAGGYPIFEERQDNVPAGMSEAALGKARTAALYGLSTKIMGAFQQRPGNEGLLVLPQALPLEGGVPLFIGGRVVGAIGVAGSDSSSDGAAAQAGAMSLAPTITTP